MNICFVLLYSFFNWNKSNLIQPVVLSLFHRSTWSYPFCQEHCHNTYCSHQREHSIITLSQNAQNLDPTPSPFLHLLNFGNPFFPFECSKHNLTTTPTTTATTTIFTKTSYKTSEFIFIYPIVISLCQNNKNVLSERSQTSSEYN